VRFRGVAGAVRIYADEVHLVLSEGPGEVAYKGTTLRCAGAATRILSASELGGTRLIEVAADEPSISFALDPADGPIETLRPGVRRQAQKDAAAYAFDAAEPLTFDEGSVSFVGRRGGVVVSRAEGGSVRVVMLDGERAGGGGRIAWGCSGPYEVTFHADRVTGRSEGAGRLLNVTAPAGVDRLASLIIDGAAYAPGTSGGTLILPLLPGRHRFEVRNLKQPPVWRNRQAW